MTLNLNLFSYRGKVFEKGIDSYVYVPNKFLSGWELEKEQGAALEELETKLGDNSVVYILFSRLNLTVEL